MLLSLSIKPLRFTSTISLMIMLGTVVLQAAHVQAEESRPATPPRAFGLGQGKTFAASDLPQSVLRQELEALPNVARQAAIDKLSSMTFHTQDIEALHSDPTGGIFYTCEVTAESKAFMLAQDALAASAEASSPTRANAERANASVPIASPPAYHSKAGSTNVIYLDFNGHIITGTAWNSSVSSYDTCVFDTDNDPTTFSDAEQTLMLRVWQRIAEDFAPFDVDVTTEEPASFTATTGRLLITKNVTKQGGDCPAPTAGGVAYVNVFGSSSYVSTYSPALVYYNNLSTSEAHISEAASHEMGHNLGLSHDGTTSAAYYGGHGSDNVSWGPLMGTGYNRNVSQWSKGEYYISNQTQDDLSIISAKMAYRTDDHGATNGTATALTITSGTIISSTLANNKGILERNTDVDVFSFTTGAGNITITVGPWRSPINTKGGNLDILAELYNGSGTLVASSNPSTDTNATFTNQAVTEGTYYLHVKNTGAGSPLVSTPTGYTSYGSIGQYFINGTILVPTNLIPTMTSVTTGSGTPGEVFTYQITATNTPTSFDATGLPAGLTINASTGLISGTPTAAAVGINTVLLSASNSTGTGNATLTLTISYSTPTITYVSNNSRGPVTGGQTLTIYGTHLENLTGITFGSIAGAGLVSSSSATSIVLTTPESNTTGAVVLSVITVGGAATTIYTYMDIPTITTISPDSGFPTGGQAVTLTGTNFYGVSSIYFGSSAATNVIVSSTTQLTCVTPSGTKSVNVVLTADSGTVTKTKGFTYQDAPTLTSLTPSSGNVEGTSVVSISGKNLLSTSQVLFGSTPATNLVITSNKITLLTPTHAAGSVDVSLVTPSGTVTKSAAYTYVTLNSPNQIPSITSPAAALPNPVTPGETLTFTIAATDADKKDKLTYAWDFGDGISGYGSSATHSYSTVGTYSATVTVSDGKNSVSSVVSVNVGSISVAKTAAIKFSFTNTSKDSFKISGVLSDANFINFLPQNTLACISIGKAIVRNFPLNKKGKGTIASVKGDSFTLSGKQSNDLFKVSSLKYTLTLQEPLFESLRSLGFPDGVVLKTAKLKVSIPVAIYVNNRVYLVQFSANYTATATAGSGVLNK